MHKSAKQYLLDQYCKMRIKEQIDAKYADKCKACKTLA